MEICFRSNKCKCVISFVPMKMAKQQKLLLQLMI